MENRILGIIAMITSYGLIRVFGYICNPRPYLWWHGLLDFIVISLFIGVPLLADHIANKNKKNIL